MTSIYSLPFGNAKRWAQAKNSLNFKTLLKKVIINIILLQHSISAFCQSGQIIGNIAKQDKLLEYQYLKVLLIRDDSTIKATIPDTNGHFVLSNIGEGLYSLVIKQIGYRDDVTDSLMISNATTKELNLIYPRPCKFVYIDGQKPKCFGEHSGNIIPIIYGLPAKKTMKKARKGLVHLGGCMVTDCDPHYYCTIHKREL